MALHFTPEELASRRATVIQGLSERRLDGLLMFRQDSMYYLTGYDSFGFCFFQCLYLGVDGRFFLLTRAPDLRQAQHTSVIGDIRIWVDSAQKTPAEDLGAVLKEYGCAGKRLGVELDAHGLTARYWCDLHASVAGLCDLQDASDLVMRLRAVKSAAEMSYVRRAGSLADDALDAALRTTAAGAFEGEILAAMQGAVFRGGGDYPGNEFIIGSGRDALLCRYFTGRRRLGASDQLTLEFAGVYRRYHACLMRTLLVGEVHAEHEIMHRTCVEAMAACRAALMPGTQIGAVFDAHARVMDAAGYREHRMNACGYGLGASYAPSWMDWPMLHTGNTVQAEPNMVFFLHMILMNSNTQRAMTLGQTVVVTESGNESLSRHPLDLIVR